MKKHLNHCPKCGSKLKITRYDCPVCDTRIEGEFTGCSFCDLSDEDRMFALIFLQTEGNMKDVERVLNISYPTVKSKLARLNQQLAPGQKEITFSATMDLDDDSPVQPSGEERLKILDRLSSGEIDAATAGKLLRGETVDDTQNSGEDKE